MSEAVVSHMFFASPPAADARHFSVISIGQERCFQPYEFKRPTGHNVEHMIYTLKGRAVGKIAEKEYFLSESSLFLTPKEEAYSYHIAEGEEEWIYRWIEFEGPWAKALLSMFRLEGVHHVPDCIAIGPVLGEMFNLLLSEGNDSLHDAHGLLIRILAAAERRHHESAGSKKSIKAATRRVYNAMTSDLARPFSLEELARVAGISKFHFTRQFKKETGLSPRNYLLSLRVSRAKVLLREGKMSVKQVGYAVGFPVPQHFAKVFRKVTGCRARDFAQGKG